jgi:hypothetical protein
MAGNQSPDILRKPGSVNATRVLRATAIPA